MDIAAEIFISKGLKKLKAAKIADDVPVVTLEVLQNAEPEYIIAYAGAGEEFVKYADNVADTAEGLAKYADEITDAAGDLAKYVDEVEDTAENLLRHADEAAGNSLSHAGGVEGMSETADRVGIEGSSGLFNEMLWENFMPPEDAAKFRKFLKEGSTAGLTPEELAGIRKVDDYLALNKVKYDEVLALRKEAINPYRYKLGVHMSI